MAERKTIQKNIRFDKEDWDLMQPILDSRDKLKFPHEGNRIAHSVIQSNEVVSVEDPYYLGKMCGMESFVKWGRYYLCARGGRYTDDKARIKKPYVFRIGKEPISIEGIKAICKGCIALGRDVDDKQFVNICFQNKLIKEKDGFVCIRGGPFNNDGDKERNPYAFKIDNTMMPLDIVRRVCAVCDWSNMIPHGELCK